MCRRVSRFLCTSNQELVSTFIQALHANRLRYDVFCRFSAKYLRPDDGLRRECHGRLQADREQFTLATATLAAIEDKRIARKSHVTSHRQRRRDRQCQRDDKRTSMYI